MERAITFSKQPVWPWALASLGVHAAVLAGLLLAWPTGGPEFRSPTGSVEVELLPAAAKPVQAQHQSSPLAPSQPVRHKQVAASRPKPVKSSPVQQARVSKPVQEKPHKTLVKSADVSPTNNKLVKKENSILNAKVKDVAKDDPRSVAGMQTPSGQNAAQARAEAVAQEEAARNLAVRQRLERFKHYPISARRRGIEGTVDVSFRLNAKGRAEDMRLVSGSGYDILDEAALDTVRRAEPFPVHTGSYRFRLRFSRS